MKIKLLRDQEVEITPIDLASGIMKSSPEEQAAILNNIAIILKQDSEYVQFIIEASFASHINDEARKLIQRINDELWQK